MLPVEMYVRVRRACLVEGMSVREAWYLGFGVSESLQQGDRGAVDRWKPGHRRPLSSMGRRTLYRTEPEQYPWLEVKSCGECQ